MGKSKERGRRDTRSREGDSEQERAARQQERGSATEQENQGSPDQPSRKQRKFGHN